MQKFFKITIDCLPVRVFLSLLFNIGVVRVSFTRDSRLDTRSQGVLGAHNHAWVRWLKCSSWKPFICFSWSLLVFVKFASTESSLYLHVGINKISKTFRFFKGWRLSVILLPYFSKLQSLCTEFVFKEFSITTKQCLHLFISYLWNLVIKILCTFKALMCTKNVELQFLIYFLSCLIWVVDVYRFDIGVMLLKVWIGLQSPSPHFIILFFREPQLMTTSAYSIEVISQFQSIRHMIFV